MSVLILRGGAEKAEPEISLEGIEEIPSHSLSNPRKLSTSNECQEEDVNMESLEGLSSSPRKLSLNEDKISELLSNEYQEDVNDDCEQLLLNVSLDVDEGFLI
jgi:hypothetical protein